MAAFMTLRGHLTDLGGGLTVRRLLPAAARQSVGPFIFFDHMGPVTLAPEQDSDVRPHPHIGLSTVTYLFEGAMMHRDSLGSVQRIEPGAINWMTAGSGIVHSERTPADARQTERRLHGLQLWAALPQELEDTTPAFAHTPAEALPRFAVGDAQVRLLIGQAWGRASPVRTPSPTLYLDVELPPGGAVELPPLADEMALYAVGTALQLTGARGDDAGDGAVGGLIEPNTLAVLLSAAEGGASQPVTVRNPAAEPARFVVIGGAPLDGHRFIWWNFVASSKERITQAAADWEQHKLDRFAPVPGEVDRIELPARRLG
jgi:redox-sensitive bicupin YhaK (pirin superfamily)